MPKRVIHGEGVWRSDKLARVEPPWVRAEYVNLIPLALANGVFESKPRRIWSEVYSYNRSDITAHDVETVILPALVKVGLLFCWKDEAGKEWGYWIGIEKPGRLPGKSRRGRNEAVGPKPPAEQLRKFMESNGIHKLLGSGSGSGSGKGSGKGAAQASPSRSPALNEKEGFKEFWQEYPRKEAKQKAADAWKKIEPKEVPEIMAGLKRLKTCEQWRDGGGKFIPHPATFLNGRRWEDIAEQPREFPIAEPYDY